MKNPILAVLDTKVDTRRYFVSGQHYFAIRKNAKSDGRAAIYLVIRDKSHKFRKNLNIFIDEKLWDQTKKRVRIPKDADNAKGLAAINASLGVMEGRLETIKATYVIQERFLSAKKLYEEFHQASPDIDFIAYYEHHLKGQPYKAQTMKNHQSVLNKLKAYVPELPFHEIDLVFFEGYRKHYEKVNLPITYNCDLKCIKTFLRMAQEQGIKMPLKLAQLKVNVESRKIIYLMPEEARRMIDYYYSQFLAKEHEIPLGTFLISCLTGLRISDLQQLTREELLQESFSFGQIKTDNQQTMKLNDQARKILEHLPHLFTEKYTEQAINRQLKNIAKVCKIHKEITMHVGRHTFATMAYRQSKNIMAVSKLLGHSKLKSTTVYVHLVEGEELSVVDLIQF